MLDLSRFQGTKKAFLAAVNCVFLPIRSSWWNCHKSLIVCARYPAWSVVPGSVPEMTRLNQECTRSDHIVPEAYQKCTRSVPEVSPAWRTECFDIMMCRGDGGYTPTCRNCCIGDVVAILSVCCATEGASKGLWFADPWSFQAIMAAIAPTCPMCNDKKGLGAPPKPDKIKKVSAF